MSVKKFACPCCQYPTLDELGNYEICPICWWEDDGQSDNNAGIVRGGPNRDYSLSEARKNFVDHWDMYRKGEQPDFLQNPRPWRISLIAYLRLVAANRIDESDFTDLLAARLSNS